MNIPPWAEELKNRYLSGEASQFILYANVRDWVCYEGQLISLQDFLGILMGKTKEVVVFYNQSEGLTFSHPTMKNKFIQSVNAKLILKGQMEVSSLPSSPSETLTLLEDFITMPGQRGAVVLDHL